MQHVVNSLGMPYVYTKPSMLHSSKGFEDDFMGCADCHLISPKLLSKGVSTSVPLLCLLAGQGSIAVSVPVIT